MPALGRRTVIDGEQRPGCVYFTQRQTPSGNPELVGYVGPQIAFNHHRQPSTEGEIFADLANELGGPHSPCAGQAVLGINDMGVRCRQIEPCALQRSQRLRGGSSWGAYGCDSVHMRVNAALVRINTTCLARVLRTHASVLIR